MTASGWIVLHRGRHGEYCIGIDSGQQGAIAVISASGALIAAADVPLDAKARPCPDGLAALAAAYPDPMFVTLETAHSMPNQGRVGIFNYGANYGALRAVFGAGNDLHDVSARKWKRALGLSSDKAESVALARVLFPREAPFLFTLQKHDGRAEAALIAHWSLGEFGLSAH